MRKAKIELKITEPSGTVTTITCEGVVQHRTDVESEADFLGRYVASVPRHEFIVRPSVAADGTTYRMEVVV